MLSALRRLDDASASLKRSTVLGLLGLPRRAKRLMAGAPVVVDGAELDLDTQLVLRLARLTREPVIETLPLHRARRAMLDQARLVGGLTEVGEVRPCRIAGLAGRLYVPRGALVTEGGAGAPLLVFFHGGGFLYGDLDTHDALCRFLAAAAGVRVVSIDYRRAPEHGFPAAYDDALAALRWVHANAASLGADPTRVAVGGDSAGANLAAGAALAAGREGLALAFQLLIYPVTDLTRASESHRLFGQGFFLTTEFMDNATQAYVPDPRTRTEAGASPLFAEIPEAVAPAYVATAGFDPLRDEGEAYARRLAQAGVTVRTRRFASLIHGFANWVGTGRANSAALDEIATELRMGLAAAPAAPVTP